MNKIKVLLRRKNHRANNLKNQSSQKIIITVMNNQKYMVQVIESDLIVVGIVVGVGIVGIIGIGDPVTIGVDHLVVVIHTDKTGDDLVTTSVTKIDHKNLNHNLNHNLNNQMLNTLLVAKNKNI